MTDSKPRAKRGSRPLTADEIVKKVRARYATQARRIAELKNEDEFETARLIARATNEDESAAARAMLSAVGIVSTIIDAEYEDPAVDSDDGAPDAEHNEDSDAGVEYGTMPPQAEQGLPKGATDYKPGPAAQAARGRR